MGGCCTIVFGADTLSDEKQQNIIRCGLRQLSRDYILDTTINQKDLGVAEEEKNGTRDWWGARGKCNSIILGAIKFRGDKKLK